MDVLEYNAFWDPVAATASSGGLTDMRAEN